MHLAEEFNLDIENRAENFVCLRLLAEFFEADRNLILIRHIFASVPDARAERRRERQSLAEDGKCGLEIAGCLRLAIQVGEAGDGKRAIGHVIVRLVVGRLLKELSGKLVLPLVIVLAAEQERRTLHAGGKRMLQNGNLAETHGEGITDWRRFRGSKRVVLRLSLQMQRVGKCQRGHDRMSAVRAEGGQKLFCLRRLPHGQKVKCHIERRLRGLGIHFGEEMRLAHAGQPPQQHMETVVLSACFNHIVSFFGFSQRAVGQRKNNGSKRVFRVVGQDLLCVRDCLFIIFPRQIDAGRARHCLGNARTDPCSLAVVVICLVGLSLGFQDETQLIIGIAAGDSRVELCQALDGASGIVLRLGKARHPVAVCRHTEQAPGVLRVALEPLEEVSVRHDRGVAVLLNVESCHVKLACRLHLSCQRHRVLDGRLFELIGLFFGIRGDGLAVCRNCDCDERVRLLPRYRHRLCRVQRHRCCKKYLAVCAHLDVHLAERFVGSMRI